VGRADLAPYYAAEALAHILKGCCQGEDGHDLGGDTDVELCRVRESCFLGALGHATQHAPTPPQHRNRQCARVK